MVEKKASDSVKLPPAPAPVARDGSLHKAAKDAADTKDTATKVGGPDKDTSTAPAEGITKVSAVEKAVYQASDTGPNDSDGQPGDDGSILSTADDGQLSSVAQTDLVEQYGYVDKAAVLDSEKPKEEVAAEDLGTNRPAERSPDPATWSQAEREAWLPKAAE